MLERHVPTAAGRFAPCRACGAEPRHILTRGRSSREVFDIHHPVGVRHALECRCGMHTARFAMLTVAEADWNLNFAAHPLPGKVAA